MFWRRSSKPDRQGQALEVTLVTVPDCHLCDRTREVLTRVVTDRPVIVHELDWNSPEGTGLVTRDGVPFAPALYINGALCAYGRVSEGALGSWLRKRRLVR